MARWLKFSIALWLVIATAMFAPMRWLSAARFSAWATGVSGLGTVTAALVAASGFRRQSEQTQRALAQADEQLQRDEQRQRRQQADQVAGWFEVLQRGPSGQPVIHVRNASDLPVHRLIAFLVDARHPRPDRLGSPMPSQLPPDAVLIDPAPPASTSTHKITYRGGAAGRRDGVQVAFTDTHGSHWLRTSWGELLALDEEPARAYNFPEPLPWNN